MRQLDRERSRDPEHLSPVVVARPQTAYMVLRYLIGIDDKVMDALPDDHLLRTSIRTNTSTEFSGAVSLIDPRAARGIGRMSVGSPTEIFDTLTAVTADMAPTLEANLRQAEVFGSEDRAAKKYVGYSLKVNSGRKILDESAKIVKPFGILRPVITRPHLILAMTADAVQARDLCAELAEIPPTARVTLGAPVVRPIGFEA